MICLKWISLALMLITGVCYFYQAAYLFLPLFRRRRAKPPAASARYAVLIAARNEEAVLPHLLDSLAAQTYPSDLLDVYVVADNCTDGTADVASAHGARVFYRFDRLHVGKGYALRYLLERIQKVVGLDRYDAFLVIDADNLLLPDYIQELNRLYAQGYDAFCGYRNTKNFDSSWISSGYALWYLHDSAHMNQSRMMLGTACMVSGTGFGFTRALLEQWDGWPFLTLTEDIEFNAWCATHGIRIGYSRDAMLFDEQPISLGQSWRQRTRWTQGGLQVSLRYGAEMLRGMGRGGRTAYASFETATLSLWGYSLSALSALFALAATVAATGPRGLALALLSALAGGYASLFFMGLLTTVMEWHRIYASTGKKIAALFTFPIFMMTFVPVAVTAVFQKFQWQPIAHTVAISADQLPTN